MSDETFFIVKTSVEDMELIDIGGNPVVDNFEALKAALIQTAGREAATLFAEPVYRRGNDRAPSVISWYANSPEDARPLLECEPEEQEIIEGKLRERLAGMVDSLSNTHVGPLIGAAMHIKDKSCIYSVGGRPVLLNWGMVPGSVGLAPSPRARHYSDTLGPYLPLSKAPPINSEEQAGLSQDVGSDASGSMGAGSAAALGAAGGLAAGVGAAAASSNGAGQGASAQTTDFSATNAASTGNAGGFGDGGPPVGTIEDRRGNGWRWIPLGVLLLLVSLFLIYLLIPGTLLYPPTTVTIGADDAARIAEEENDSLRQRRDELEQALEGAVCLDDGTLRFPPSLDEAIGAVGSGNGERGQSSEEILTPPPNRVEVPPPPGSDGEPQDLLSFTEARTALIITEFPDSTGIGTGFFVAPDLLVTNDHVIFGSQAGAKRERSPQGIFVKSKALGRVIRADLIASSGQSGGLGQDFALLRVPGANAQFFSIWNSENSIKLEPVIAAGFPGAYFVVDQEGSAIWNSQSPEVPDMIMTQGTVNAQQRVGGQGVLSLIHSADISSGNSGGPLVDQCGRVVGVNTFGIQDEITQRFLNFAQHTTELVRFAQANGQSLPVTTDACEPTVAGVDEPPREESEPEEAGEPPAEETPEAETPEAE